MKLLTIVSRTEFIRQQRKVNECTTHYYHCTRQTRHVYAERCQNIDFEIPVSMSDTNYGISKPNLDDYQSKDNFK